VTEIDDLDDGACPPFARDLDNDPDSDDAPFIGPLNRPISIALAAICNASVAMPARAVVCPISLGVDASELLLVNQGESFHLPASKREVLLTQLPKSFTATLPAALSSDPLLSRIVAAPSDYPAFSRPARRNH
jgi:hypothetical protein